MGDTEPAHGAGGGAGEPAETGSAPRTYRRHVRLLERGAGAVEGELADDAQHFRVRLRHDGRTLRALEGETVRAPWSTCSEAGARLEALVGMPLSPRCTAVGEVSPARTHCTHLFDLAGLAVAHAARGAAGGGAGLLEYRCAVWDDASARTRATLERNGERWLDWALEGLVVRAAPPFDGASLKGSFLAWAQEQLAPELAEAAIVLRRACYISPVRFYELDGFARASDVQPVTGQCYTYTQGVAQRAARWKGSRRDFTEHPDALLGDPPAPA